MGSPALFVSAAKSAGSDLLVDIADDPTLRALLRAARAWGVPLSTFLGAKVVTKHYYAEGGRLVRSETESEWTSDDREAALGLLAWEADLCPGCGHPLSETTKWENSDRYVPRPYIVCHRCVAIDIAAKAHKDADHPSAMLFPVELEEESDS